MNSFSFLNMDHDQYDYLGDLNANMTISISHEMKSLTNCEGDHFSIEDSSKVQENSSNHNIE